MMSDLSGFQADRSDIVNMSDRDFDWIAKIAHSEFGLCLPSSKKSLVFSRLVRRLRILNLPNFSAYCSFISSPEGVAEKTELLSSLTTNVTKFFREKHHFDHLKEAVLPELIERAKKGGRVRIWSAGCSSGQEAYSIAMLVLSLFPEARKTNLKILATDIDPAILAKAQDGVYEVEQLSDIPNDHRKFITILERPKGNHFTIIPEAKSLVTFGIANLISELPVSGPFDIIFCRNVAIYFDKATQGFVWSRFEKLIDIGGYLYIGHSERISGPATDLFANTGITTYQRKRESF